MEQPLSVSREDLVCAGRAGSSWDARRRKAQCFHKASGKKNIAGNIFLAENIQSWKQSTDSQGENAKLTEPALPLPGTPASCLLWEQPDKDINQAACTASPNTGHHMSACQLISVGFTSATDPRISWK